MPKPHEMTVVITGNDIYHLPRLTYPSDKTSYLPVGIFLFKYSGHHYVFIAAKQNKSVMGLGATIRKQFGNPEGWLGYIIGWVLATKNRERITWAVKMLNIQPADKILEIGCGPGKAIQQIAPKLTTGNITAIDRSAVMIDMSSKINKKFVSSGKVTLGTGLLPDMKFPAHYFDKIFAVNVTLFWQNPLAELQTVKENLSDKGAFYIFHQPAMTKDKGLTRQFAEKMYSILEQAGYYVTDTKYKDIEPVPVVCIICKPK